MHSSNHIFLVRPAHFGYNAETAVSNAFQHQVTGNPESITQQAIAEFDAMAEQLSNKGVHVTVIADTKDPIKPDAVFPNNWGSFHPDGTVVLYPMLAENRRLEKRPAILDTIAEQFQIQQVIDLSEHEEQNTFLEGTGSIIFDHNHNIAYACLSPRTDKALFVSTCEMLGYQPVYFYAKDKAGQEIYHTNVMMNIGNGYAVVCLESITDPSEKQQVITSLESSGNEIIDISLEQMSAFCGNMLELALPNQQNILAMSQSAFNGLTATQKATLEKYCELFPINVNTIEQIGGGSVRCMISEIFLPKKG